MAQRQRHQRRPAKGSNLKPFYVTLAILATAGIGWIVYSLAGGGQRAALEAVELTGLEDPEALISAAKGETLGEPGARARVLVFSDFTCPGCKSWSTAIEPQLKQEFVEGGQVRLEYYDFPLGGSGQHRHSFVAARAARCAADQDRFWDYHDVLFARQSEWSFASSPPLDEFIEYAGQLGLDTNAFESCVNSERHADVVSANHLLGENLGVSGTPTVFIGNRSVRDWSDYNAVRAAVQRELGS